MLEGEYHVLSDGWIKIDRTDFAVGLTNVRPVRLLVGLNQLLLKIAGKVVLIDTGLGTKWRPDQVGLLDYEQPRQLLTAMESLGITPDQVDLVILSHLHYDHSGGGTTRVGEMIAPTFENAVYYVQLDELVFARNPPPEKVDDYRLQDFDPLIATGQLISLQGESEIIPGLFVAPAPGHTPGHQAVIAHFGKETVFFPGDLISTRAHANQRISMVYDEDRSTVLAERGRWLARAREGHWKVVYCHAYRDPIGTLS